MPGAESPSTARNAADGARIRASLAGNCCLIRGAGTRSGGYPAHRVVDSRVQPCPPRESARQLTEHVQSLGLHVEHVEAFDLGGGAVVRSLGQLFGSFSPNYVERYALAAPDGLRWVYVQPYSNKAAMPGEHHFALRGAPDAPVWGEGSSWVDRNRSLVLRLAIIACATLIGLPIGVLLFVLMIGRAPKLHGGAVAATLARVPALQRFRYVGGFFARDFLIPWSIQLHSVGQGASRLVCVDPGSVKRGLGILQRPRPSMVEAADLARHAQMVLPAYDVPPQPPHDALGWDDLARPWLEPIAATVRSGGFVAAPLPQVTTPRPPSRKWAWAGLVAGIGSVLFGLFWVVLGISMIVHPAEPKAVDSGWCCLISTTLTCVLPGFAGAAYAAYRLFGRPNEH